MNNIQGKNKILIYFLAIFSAVYVGTGIFLILNYKKPPAKKEITSTSLIIPTVKTTQMSLNIKLSEKKGIILSANEELKIDLVADSDKKNIIGYDLALSYDSLAFDFIKATSSLTDFKIFSYKRDNHLSFLGTKSLQSQTPSVFTRTKIASLFFKPMKTGKYNFSLKPFIDKDKTDLVTDKTEVINPKLNELEIKVL